MGGSGWGGGVDIFNGITNHNQSLAIGMDHSSVYDNENEGGRYMGCGQVGVWGGICQRTNRRWLLSIRIDWNIL